MALERVVVVREMEKGGGEVEGWRVEERRVGEWRNAGRREVRGVDVIRGPE